MEVNGRIKVVDVRRANGRFVVTIDGRDHEIDAARVNPYTLSLLVSSSLRSPSRTAAGAAVEEQPATPARSYEVALAPAGSNGLMNVRVGAAPLVVSLNGRRSRGRGEDAARGASGPQAIAAPMPGKVVRVLVKPGEAVRARQPVVVIEAMKMENELRAPASGVVSEVTVRDGQSVEAGALLAVITPEAAP